MLYRHNWFALHDMVNATAAKYLQEAELSRWLGEAGSRHSSDWSRRARQGLRHLGHSLVGFGQRLDREAHSIYTAS